MMIDEWVDEVAALGKEGLDDEQLWPAIKQLVLRFGQAEAERCAAVCQTVAWDNECPTVDAEDKIFAEGALTCMSRILATSPGKAGIVDVDVRKCLN